MDPNFDILHGEEAKELAKVSRKALCHKLSKEEKMEEDQSQKLKDKLNQQAKEAKHRLALFKEFPDLTEYGDRWHKYLCSKSVNSIAEYVGFAHSCGCCPDSTLYAMPYVRRNSQYVYSDPCQIYIGEKVSDGYGERPRDNWEKEIRAHGLPEHIVEKIKIFFAENKVEPFDDDDED